MQDRIKELRKELGLTQRQFGERVGVKQNTIANYEIGRNEPADAVIGLICREFNVSETWLRTGEGEMFLPAPEDELDALVRRYGLSDGDRILIQRFLALPDDAREYVLDYVLSVADAVRAGADPAALVPSVTLPDAVPAPQAAADAARVDLAELDRQYQAARQQILSGAAAEEARPGGPSVSYAGGSGTGSPSSIPDAG